MHDIFTLQQMLTQLALSNMNLSDNGRSKQCCSMCATARVEQTPVHVLLRCMQELECTLLAHAS
jgi:hypothetical protein